MIFRGYVSLLSVETGEGIKTFACFPLCGENGIAP